MVHAVDIIKVGINLWWYELTDTRSLHRCRFMLLWSPLIQPNNGFIVVYCYVLIVALLFLFRIYNFTILWLDSNLWLEWLEFMTLYDLLLLYTTNFYDFIPPFLRLWKIIDLMTTSNPGLAGEFILSNLEYIYILYLASLVIMALYICFSKYSI